MTEISKFIQQKVEDWGKTKFKPSIGRTSLNPFAGKQNFNRTDNEDGGAQFRNGGFRDKGASFKGNNNRGGGSGRNYGNRGNGKFNRGNGKFNMDKNDRVRFNAIARDAKPEVATPWNMFKDEINYKQREEMQKAAQANMNTEDAKNALKEREKNYRLLLMEQKKQETIEWEDFGTNDACNLVKGSTRKKEEHIDKKLNVKTDTENNNSKNNKRKNKIKNVISEFEIADTVEEDKNKLNEDSTSQKNQKTGNEDIGKSQRKKRDKREKKLQTNSKEINSEEPDFEFKVKKSKRKHLHMQNDEQPLVYMANDEEGIIKKKHNKMHKQKKNEKEPDIGETSGLTKFKPIHAEGCKPLVSKAELKNFDAKNLSFHQKDVLRKIITKSVTSQKGTTFLQRLKNRKYQNACKEIKKNLIKK